MTLAEAGKQVGVDLYADQTKDGRGVRRALDYLTPDVQAAREWPRQQINEMESARRDLARLLRRAPIAYCESQLDRVERSVQSDSTKDDFIACVLADRFGFDCVRARRPRVARPERQAGAGQGAASADAIDGDAQFVAAARTAGQTPTRLRDGSRNSAIAGTRADDASRSLAARAAAGSRVKE